MNAPRLFIMALYAVKPDPELMDVTEESEVGRISFRVHYRDGEVQLSSPIGLAPYAEVAQEADEAKQMGLETALELWPREQGWVGHAVAVSSRNLEADFKEEAFGWMPNALDIEDEEEDNEDAGVLM